MVVLALIVWSLQSIIYCVGFCIILLKTLPLLLAICKKWFGAQQEQLNEQNPEKDVVYLFQFPGTSTAPSTSPFSVKIEAFCRLHNIKYKKRSTFTPLGNHSHLPYVEFNGESIHESESIIRRLTEKMQLQTYHDDVSAATGHAIDRMLDNHTFHHIVRSKLHKLGPMIDSMAKRSDLSTFVASIAAYLGTKNMRDKIENRVRTSVGVFTEKEHFELLKNDLLQLQTILGKKNFLLGAEPSAADCTALGQLGVAYYAVPSARTNVHELLDSEELAVLKEYLVRTKEAIYGDQFFDPIARL